LASYCAEADSSSSAEIIGHDDFPSGDSHTLPHAASQQAATGKKEAIRRTATQQALANDEYCRIERPLTCEEAAELVRVHPKTVKRMARTGELPGHFRFGRWFFYASELDSWMRTELHSSRHSCR
jgi:excisionase family DNA binding protein